MKVEGDGESNFHVKEFSRVSILKSKFSFLKDFGFIKVCDSCLAPRTFRSNYKSLFKNYSPEVRKVIK